MTIKPIQYNVAITSTKVKRIYDIPKAYTNDLNSVEFQFTITDLTAEELSTATANVLLYMSDGSFFQNTSLTGVTIVGTVVKYTMKENEGNHSGVSETQVEIFYDLDPDKKLASQRYQFEILNGLETEVAVEVMIQDWTTLTAEARTFIDNSTVEVNDLKTELQTAINTANTSLGEFDIALQNGIVATNIAAELQDLETTYAPEIVSLRESLEQAATKDELSAVASPLVASLVAQMTDTTRVYVYTGAEGGYVAGNWYYHNGTAWVSGGVYQASGIGNGSVTDDKLASDGVKALTESIAAQLYVPSETTFTPNLVDLATTTSTAVNNANYYSPGVCGERGYLKGAYVKSTGTTIKIVAGTVSGGVFTLTHDYGTFYSAELDGNGYLTIDDDAYILQADEYICVQQSVGTFYYTGGTYTHLQLNSSLAATSTTSQIVIGVNFVLSELGIGDMVTPIEFSGVSADIETLKSATVNNIMTKKYMPVFTADISAVNSFLTVENQRVTPAWTYDYVNKYVYPNALGGYYDDGYNALPSRLGNVLKINRMYNSDMKVFKFDAVLFSDTVLNVHMYRGQRNGEKPNESLYVVDIPNNKMAMTQKTDDRNLIVGTYLAEAAITFPFVSGNKYQIEVEKYDYEFYLRIRDYKTGASTELHLTGWGAGTQLHYYGISWGAGVTAPRISKISVWMPKNPKTVFTGDSITEGKEMSALTGTNLITNRFAERARKAIGDSVISAASSGTIDDVIALFDSEFSIYKPDYLFVTIGTNGTIETNSIVKYQQIEDLCVSNGITLILNHIPCSTAPTVYHNEKNVNIDAVYTDGCKFDVATAIGNNIANAADATLFADGTHPNNLGSGKLFDRIKVDVPYLFY